MIRTISYLSYATSQRETLVLRKTTDEVGETQFIVVSGSEIPSGNTLTPEEVRDLRGRME